MEEEIIEDEIIYEASDFPGMRETGRVKQNNNYVVAEYEDHDLRIEEIAKQINSLISSRFILYDYKGSILTDNQEVQNVLEAKYPSGVDTQDGDTLTIPYDLLKIEAKNKENKKSVLVIPNKIQMKQANSSFGVKKIAGVIASIISKIPNESGMMIGIFGKWGRGKTYFAKQIKECLLNENLFDYEFIDFSAWKYQERDSLWAYLYETLFTGYLDLSKGNFISRYIKNKIKIFRLNTRIHRLWNIIYFVLSLSTLIFINFYLNKIGIIKIVLSTFNIVVLFKIYFIILKKKNSAIGIITKYLTHRGLNENLGFQAEVESKIDNLLTVWIPKKQKNKKIVLFVDDIDRCEVKNIISIIDGLRTVLDNTEIQKRLIIITAVDDVILEQSLRIKYSDLPNLEKINSLYTDYLQKVFILGIKLNDLKKSEIIEFTKNLIPTTNIGLNTLGESLKVNLKDINNNISITKSLNNFSNDDLTISERNKFIELVTNLKNATPRSISVLYYKYLIIKKLLWVRLNENGIDIDQTELNDGIIINGLIAKCNGSIAGEKSINELDPVIKADLVNVLEMFSIV